MRLPYEKYILYLLMTKHTDAEVIDKLSDFSLPKIGNVYLNGLRKVMHGEDLELDDFLASESINSIFKFRRPDVKTEWLKKFDILEAHDGTLGFNEAYSIFCDGHKRNILNIFCMCPDLVPERISELYENKFGMQIPEESLEIYQKYFFDINILSQTDWLSYIKKFDAKTRILYEAAPSRRSKYVRWKMGDEVHLDPADVSSLLMTDFFFLAQDEQLSKGEDWADKSVRFAGLALSASDRAMKNKKVTGKNMKLDLVTLFEEEEEMPSYDDLVHEDDDE